ncbi:Uncharacterised protein [Mycobacteroides abscessus subsp. abscessus]|nr:Uncharacterised protein [Mycobacteroides abscessus subsp. abscessus]
MRGPFKSQIGKSRRGIDRWPQPRELRGERITQRCERMHSSPRLKMQ